MRRAPWMLACTLACTTKDSADPPTSAPRRPPADAAAEPAWIARCETALRDAVGLPSTRRVAAVLDGCRPCGDWAPLLGWNTRGEDGGPTRKAIEDALEACNAYCEPAARQRMLGALDDARGKPVRTPWRLLGDVCKEKVSALPDARFMSAPFFALDRIGREASARPRLALLLDGLELPLPPVTVTGSGFDLEDSPATAPEAGPFVLTVTAADYHLGTLPRARLTHTGVTLLGAGELYPGPAVKKAGLAAAYDAAGKNIGPIAVIAPPGLKANLLVDAVKAARHHQLRLAVAASGAPTDWTLAGTIPVDLVASHPPDRKVTDRTTLVLGASADGPIREARARGTRLGNVTIQLTGAATFANLVKLVGTTATFGVKAVALK